MPSFFDKYSERFQQADSKTKLFILIAGFILLLFLLFTGLFFVVVAVIGVIYIKAEESGADGIQGT